MSKRELFGGAMECALPSKFADVSEFRQVPDNQEVFTDANTGCCVIVELASRQGTVADDAAAEFFFKDLAECNKAPGWSIAHKDVLPPAAVPGIPQLESVVLVEGVQQVSKFNEAAANDVAVSMLIARIPPPLSCDVLITTSAPLAVENDSSEAKVVKECLTSETVSEQLKEVGATLVLNDPSLFVAEE